MPKRPRRALTALLPVLVVLALPAAAAAAGAAKIDKPEGHDYTLDTIFVVALGLPLLIALLTLIDVARGRHTGEHGEH